MRGFWRKFNRNQQTAAGDESDQNPDQHHLPLSDAGQGSQTGTIVDIGITNGSTNVREPIHPHHQGLQPIVLPITEAVTRMTAVTTAMTSSSMGNLENVPWTGESAGKPTYALFHAKDNSHSHEASHFHPPSTNTKQASRPGTDLLTLAGASSDARRMVIGSRDSNRSGGSRLATADLNSLQDADRLGGNAVVESGEDGVGSNESTSANNRVGSENFRSKSFAGDPRKGDLLSLASFYKDVKTKTMGDISNMISLGPTDINNLFGRPHLSRRRSEENVNDYGFPYHHHLHNPLMRNPSNPPPTPIVSSGGTTPAPSTLISSTSALPSTAPSTSNGSTKPWKLQPLATLSNSTYEDQQNTLLRGTKSLSNVTSSTGNYMDGRVLKKGPALISTVVHSEEDDDSSLGAAVPLPAPRGLHLSVNFSNATGRRLAKLDATPAAASVASGESLQMFRAKTLPGIKSTFNSAGFPNGTDNQENEEGQQGEILRSTMSATSQSSLIGDPDTDTDL